MNKIIPREEIQSKEGIYIDEEPEEVNN